jgi:hypothetical protein
MTVSSKRKRTTEKYKAFGTALFCSLVGLTFYLLGKFVIPFPSQWFLGSNSLSGKKPKLFLFGIGIHSTVNFYLGMIFMILNQAEKKFDSLKVRR